MSETLPKIQQFPKDSQESSMAPLRPNTHQARNRLKIPQPRPKSQDRPIQRVLENRYKSSEVKTISSHFLNHLVANRSPTASPKKARKISSKPLALDMNIFRPFQESRKKCVSKTFIGSRLRKRIRNYMLLLAVVNYGLRCIFSRLEVKSYKVFVGKGNNSKVIKQVFGQRFWWTVTLNEAEANLVWTQKTNKKTMEKMAVYQPKQIENQKINGMIREVYPKSKLKCKRGHLEEEYEHLLAEKDILWLSVHCRRDYLADDLKAVAKRTPMERRNAVQLSHNHIENHRLLTNKKNLFSSVVRYCKRYDMDPFDSIPMTFHLEGEEP